MHDEQFRPGVSLRQLLASCQFFRGQDVRVESCCADFARCRPGDLYVAIVGPDGDGHDYAHDAVERGAIAVLTERILPVDVPQCVVPDTTIAFSQLCHHLAGAPATGLNLVGVAGMYGKSVTQVLSATVLEAIGQRPAIFGSLGSTDGVVSRPLGCETPMSMQYVRWLAEVRANGCTHAITEIDRHELLRNSFAGAQWDTLMLTGLCTESHRRAPSPRVHDYFRRAVGMVKKDGMIVANVDCPVVRRLIPQLEHAVLTVAIEEPADITATILEQFPSEQTFLIEAGSETAVVRCRLIGDHFVRLALLSAAHGLAQNRSLTEIALGLEAVTSVPGQLERVECGQAFSVFVDSARSPQLLRQSLHTVRDVTRGRVICVVGEGERQFSHQRSLRGRMTEQLAHRAILTSDSVGDPQPLRAAHDLLDGFRHPEKPLVIPNRMRAIEYALQQAQPDDSVLIVGPHNRRLASGTNDFLPDVEVARYCLLDGQQNFRPRLLAMD